MKSAAIWHPSPAPGAPFLYLRQVFNASAAVEGARLRCAGDGPYEIYVNGESAGRAPERVQDPVWMSFAIGHLLRPGENVLLVLAAGSWFRAEGEIEYAGGQRAELGTGTLWQVLSADAWQSYAQAPLTEAYFAAREPGDWQRGRFCPGEWEAAVEVEGPEPLTWSPLPVREREVCARAVIAFGEVEAGGALRFEEEPGPMETGKCVHHEALLQVGRRQTLVQTRSEQRAAYLVLDFGRLLSGLPRLRLRGVQGATIDMGWARQRGRIDGGLRYVCGEGVREWTHARPVSARYAVLRIGHCAESMEVDCLSLVESSAEVEAGGAFAGGELEALWQTGRRSLEASRLRVYRAQQGADYDWQQVYVLALNDYCLSGNSTTAASTLDSARPPRPAGGARARALWWVLCAGTYYRYSGDQERGERLLAGVLQVLDACRESAGREGLEAEEGWSWTALNALWAAALEAGEQLCRGLRQRRESGELEQEYQRARRRLQRAWSFESKLFADAPSGGELAQWSNALVLYFGLGRDEELRQAAEQVRGISAGRVEDLWQAFFLAGGLLRAGQAERGLDYVRQQWGRLQGREGRTWGEKAGSAQVLPGCEYLLADGLLGVRPSAPGFRRLEIRPRTEALPSASGRVPTARGAVEVQWRWSDPAGRLYLRAALEGEGDAQLAVPRMHRRFPTLTLNGETVWRNEKVYPNDFAREIISEEERVVLVLHRDGEYEVQVE